MEVPGAKAANGSRCATGGRPQKFQRYSSLSPGARVQSRFIGARQTAGMDTNVSRTLRRWLAALLLAAPAALPAAQEFTRAELDQMLAPIALYPDTVLSHVLIAATYPDEVEEAARWSRRHPDLRGEEAVDAVEDRDWDPSVKALVAFPEVLERMDADMDWTERLGDAFLAQEDDVMDTVQGLRDRAYEAGHLDSLEHVRVIREREYIYIEPAVTHIVYVPYYDPWWVYGTWWWPAYPPYYWAYWGGYPYSYYHTHYHTAFYWGTGFRVAPTFYFATFHWPQRQVVVVNRYRAPPVYSGRDVSWRSEVQHWHQARNRTENRQARPGAAARARPERREERADRREQRANGRQKPDAAPGRVDRHDFVEREQRLSQQPRERQRRDRSAERREQASRGDRRDEAPRAQRRDDPPRRSRDEGNERTPERARVQRGESVRRDHDSTPAARGQGNDRENDRENGRGNDRRNERRADRGNERRGNQGRRKNND
jgi:hypothetical protein